jgi:hypothetical protein
VTVPDQEVESSVLDLGTETEAPDRAEEGADHSVLEEALAALVLEDRAP